MSEVNERDQPLFAGEEAERESLIERFEEAWQLETQPNLAQFLAEATRPPAPHSGPRLAGERGLDARSVSIETLVELVHIDLENRLKRGEAARVEMYFDDYAEFSADPENVISLIATEYEFRSRREAGLTSEEFLERFPKLASELASRLSDTKRVFESDAASICDSEERITLHEPRRDASLHDDLVGKQIREYRIVEKIGEGGMGTVFRATHTRLGKDVAIKVLPDALLKDEQACTRFSREMLAVGRLDHPNVVRATDAGEAEGRHFLVMEIVDGVDVAAIATREKQLPIADACEIVRQAAVGLQHVHENGLVHRDLKPSNFDAMCCNPFN